MTEDKYYFFDMNKDRHKLTFHVADYGGKDWKDGLELKEQILRKPLGQSFTQKEIFEEEAQTNIVGKINGEVIATALLVVNGSSCKMQRVTVLQALQGQGIGQKLLHYCEELMVSQNISSMYCHARNTAVDFYAQNGYQTEGDYFDEDEIPHLKMRKSLI